MAAAVCGDVLRGGVGRVGGSGAGPSPLRQQTAEAMQAWYDQLTPEDLRVTEALHVEHSRAPGPSSQEIPGLEAKLLTRRSAEQPLRIITASNLLEEDSA
jgi:hypothetical protein